MTLGEKIRHPAVPVLDTDCRYALCRFPESRDAHKIGMGVLDKLE
jgi:hypothetical protein